MAMNESRRRIVGDESNNGCMGRRQDPDRISNASRSSKRNETSNALQAASLPPLSVLKLSLNGGSTKLKKPGTATAASATDVQLKLPVPCPTIHPLTPCLRERRENASVNSKRMYRILYELTCEQDVRAVPPRQSSPNPPRRWTRTQTRDCYRREWKDRRG